MIVLLLLCTTATTITTNTTTATTITTITTNTTSAFAALPKQRFENHVFLFGGHAISYLIRVVTVSS